jgi:hypothetical protein
MYVNTQYESGRNYTTQPSIKPPFQIRARLISNQSVEIDVYQSTSVEKQDKFRLPDPEVKMILGLAEARAIALALLAASEGFTFDEANRQTTQFRCEKIGNPEHIHHPHEDFVLTCAAHEDQKA